MVNIFCMHMNVQIFSVTINLVQVTKYRLEKQRRSFWTAGLHTDVKYFSLHKTNPLSQQKNLSHTWHFSPWASPKCKIQTLFVLLKLTLQAFNSQDQAVIKGFVFVFLNLDSWLQLKTLKCYCINKLSPVLDWHYHTTVVQHVKSLSMSFVQLMTFRLLTWCCFSFNS